MSVKAQTEKNFRRAKVKPAKRKGAGRFLSWHIARAAICAAIVIYAGYRAVDLVVSASALQVQKIEVHGNVRLSSGEVQVLMDGLVGSNIVLADLDVYRQRVLASRWVDRVAMRRVLPSTIEVFVSERTPIGICRLRDQLHLVDRTGMLIDEYGPQYSEFDLPVIDGLVRAPSSGEPTIDERRADLAARVIDSVSERQEIASRISQIDVSNADDAVVLLEDDPALLHLGNELFLERLQSYVDVADALRDHVDEIDYVDLRFGERVYLRPTGNVKRPAPAGGGMR